MLNVASANSTNAGNSETSINLLNDRINLIAATTLLGVFYGIVATLYCMTTYFLLKKLFRRNVRFGSHPDSLPRYRTERRKTLFYIAYTTILFILVTLYTACNSQNAIVAYVDNRLYPEGPYEYYITFMARQTIMVTTDVTSTIMFWMTDALILCRFIVFYYHVAYARWIIPLACAMYSGVVVFSILVLQGEAGLGKIFYLSEILILIYYVLSFSLNVLATVMIAARLYWHKVQLERVFGEHEYLTSEVSADMASFITTSALVTLRTIIGLVVADFPPRSGSKVDSPYMGIVTMLIESAALYGAWSLVFLVLYTLKSPGQTIILATMSQIQVIAPLLIILWIARGKAWRYGKHYEDEESDPPAGLRFDTGSPARPTGEHSTYVSRNASCSTVVGGRGGDDLKV